MKLYRPFSRVNGEQYNGRSYDHAIVGWFIIGRKEPLAVGAEIVAPDATDDPYRQAVGNELFTDAEVQQLREYLGSQSPPVCVECQEVQLPIADCRSALGALEPRAHEEDNWRILADPTYSLPFRVAGFVESVAKLNVLKRYLRLDDIGP